MHPAIHFFLLIIPPLCQLVSEGNIRKPFICITCVIKWEHLLDPQTISVRMRNDWGHKRNVWCMEEVPWTHSFTNVYRSSFHWGVFVALTGVDWSAICWSGLEQVLVQFLCLESSILWTVLHSSTSCSKLLLFSPGSDFMLSEDFGA